MIETTLPTDLFDQTDWINRNEDIHSILRYIGLITVILLFFCIICSLICKCIKLLNDETVPTKKKIQPQIRRYRTNSLTSKQTILSSASSSSSLRNYHRHQSHPKPSTVRILQYQNQYSLPIIHV